MSVLIQGSQVRQILIGTKVDRATATLPQTAQGSIFTVSGGRILLTGLVGEVTTATGATATTLKVTSNPTTGTDVDLTSATAITSKEIGAQFTLPATSGSGLVVPVGTIDIVTSASDTGSVKWSLTYVPLDDGATVTAA
jgi:hypothetical protein